MAKPHFTRKCLRVAAVISAVVVIYFTVWLLCVWAMAGLVMMVDHNVPSDGATLAGNQSIWDGLLFVEPLECNEKNWSAGSAFFALLAVVSTYILQPRGSHAFPEAGRIWRLSPLFTLFETIWMCSWVIEGRFARRSFSATCVALAVARVTLARRISSFDAFPLPRKPLSQRWKKFRQARFFREFLPFIILSKIYRLAHPHDGEGVSVQGSSTSHDTAGRKQAAIQTDETAYGYLPAFPDVDSGPSHPPHRDPYVPVSFWHSGLAQLPDLIDDYFDDDVKELRYLESDLAMRFFVWGIMLLQLVKLFSVTGGHFARALIALYWTAWLFIEIMLVTAENSKLTLIAAGKKSGTREENYELKKVRRLWSRSTVYHVLPWKIEEIALEGSRTEKFLLLTFALNLGCALVVHLVIVPYLAWSASLVVLVTMFQLHGNVRPSSSLTSLAEAAAGVTILALTAIVLLLATLFFLCPMWLSWLQNLFATFWKWSGAAKTFGREVERAEVNWTTTSFYLQFHEKIVELLLGKGADPNAHGGYYDNASPWAVNTSTKLWGSVAAEFKSEHWMAPGKANSGGAESNYAFLMFLHEPRSCIGQGFANADFMGLLAGCVGAFETRLKHKEKEIKVDITGDISVKPKDGLWVVRLLMRT